MKKVIQWGLFFLSGPIQIRYSAGDKKRLPQSHKDTKKTPRETLLKFLCLDSGFSLINQSINICSSLP